MLNQVREKISVLKDELVYRAKLRQHYHHLPILTGGDRLIAESLKKEGIIRFITKELMMKH
jgi:hypothetical protein